jgi:hypothetical protein
MKKIILIIAITLILSSIAIAYPYQHSNIRGYGYNQGGGYYSSGIHSYSYNYYNHGSNYGYGGYAPVYYGARPALMPSRTCNIIGCSTNYVSHMNIRNALDYTYYTNPRLFEPRYMDNQQRIYRGAWSQ